MEDLKNQIDKIFDREIAVCNRNIGELNDSKLEADQVQEIIGRNVVVKDTLRKIHAEIVELLHSKNET